MAPAVIVKNRKVSLFLIDVCQIRCQMARPVSFVAESVPDPADRQQVFGDSRILFELLAQVADVHVDRSLVTEAESPQIRSSSMSRV